MFADLPLADRAPGLDLDAATPGDPPAHLGDDGAPDGDVVLAGVAEEPSGPDHEIGSGSPALPTRRATGATVPERLAASGGTGAAAGARGGGRAVRRWESRAGAHRGETGNISAMISLVPVGEATALLSPPRGCGRLPARAQS